MKTAKITYGDVKHFLTEEQRAEYEDPEKDFKKFFDRNIRNANKTVGNKSQAVLEYRSNTFQLAYSKLQNLTFEQSERFAILLDRLSKSDLEEMDYRNIASEYKEFEEMELLHVSRTQPYNRVLWAGLPYPGEEVIKPMFEELRKTYLYKDLL